MLVLNRKIGEKIHIGGQIDVAVLSVKGGRVKIGIEAPREISVYRKELYDAAADENRRIVFDIDMETEKHHSEEWVPGLSANGECS